MKKKMFMIVTLKKDILQDGTWGVTRGKGARWWGQQRSEVPLVKHLVDAVTDPLQVSAINLWGPVESRQEVTVGEVIEDVIDAWMALGCQVAFDGLVQQFAALIQNGAHDPAVKGELDLVEADRRHGQSVDFLPVRQKERRGCQFLVLTGAAEAKWNLLGKNRNCCLVIFLFGEVSQPHIGYSIVLCSDTSPC